MDRDSFIEGGGGAMGAQPLLDLKIFFSGPNESWTPGKKNNLFLPPGEIPVYTHPGTIPFFFKPTIFKGLENYSHLLLSLRRPPPPLLSHRFQNPPRFASSQEAFFFFESISSSILAFS